MSKIQMTTPLVEMDGDEMTRILWKMIKDELLLPFIDLKTEYYDLGLEYRNETNDQVTVDSANATLKYGVAVKCATITPNAARMTEYNLKEMWKSPNGTIRAILDGTVFRTPIVVKGIEPCVKNWKKPITLARHAYGDVYKNTEMKIAGPGKAELVFTAEDGTETREVIHVFDGPGIIQGIHNTEKSISSFARACLSYAVDTKQDLWFSTKDTISKKYDHTFKDIFQDIYEKEYMNPDREEITAYRGHFKNSYELKPGIGRIEDPHGEKERELFMQFKRSYQSFSTVQPKRDIDLLFLAQHYGLKTRILDWTLNPLVALFFACYEEHPSKSEENEDGEVIIKNFPKPGSLREDTSENDKLGWYNFLHQKKQKMKIRNQSRLIWTESLFSPTFSMREFATKKEFFNILKGDMSFIGPRPLLVSYLPYYTETEALRHTVRPGLTGLAQVSGRNFLDWDRRLAKDVEYVKGLSFQMDLKVLFLTVKVVFDRSDVAEDTSQAEGNFARIRQERLDRTGRLEA